jgi:hypothetical protein
MKRASRTVRPSSVLVAVIAVSAFAGVGFLVGRSNRTPPARVASARAGATASSYLRAEAAAYRLGWVQSYHHGWRAGSASATTVATRAGRLAGRAEAAKQTVTSRLLAAVLASTPIRLSRTTKTAVCVPVGGGVCEVLGPGVTGRHCPPASVANPRGGVVCVPRLLLLAARMAGIPTADLAIPTP